MSTLRQKVAVYLGLSEEDYGFEYDERGEREDRRPAARPTSDIAVEQSSPAFAPAGRPRRIEAAYDVVRMTPSAYSDVRSIGEGFRAGDVISMDLSGLTADDAKRMIDFASGLTFGLQGTIERVGGKVFLLTPKGVEVTASVRASLVS
ncbi:MAG TPA: cell division protein SepF [Actinomycetota bacterium]|nr:cell division protein SepF [Actinomycetota bacterium]